MKPDPMNIPIRAPHRLLIAVLLATIALAGAAQAQDRIVLRGSVRLDAGQLTVSLADVAELQGDVAQALGDQVVFEISTQPSRPVTVNLSLIRQRLDDSGANLGLLALSGRDCVIRWRSSETPGEAPVNAGRAQPTPDAAPTFASQFVREKSVRGMVAAYLSSIILHSDPSNVQLTFRSSDQEELQLSTAGYELEIKPLASKLSPTIPLLINFFQGSTVVRSIRITVDVAVRQRVLVVQRYTSRGDILNPGDVVEETRIVEPQMSAPLQYLEDVLGMEVRGRLVPGQILREGDTVSRIVVTRNSEVTIRARHGMFVLRMRARVLEDGRVGELVRVQRITDRVQLLGMVEADGEISIDTGYVDAGKDAR